MDYPCAERLQWVLLTLAKHLERHGVVTLTPKVEGRLADISRSTLARRIATWPSPEAQVLPFKATLMAGSARTKANSKVGRHAYNLLCG